MSITNYDLNRDVINTEVLSKTNYEITSATAAQERNINSFVMEAGSTGFLVNAKGTTTSTPLSAAFRNISNISSPLLLLIEYQCLKIMLQQQVFQELLLLEELRLMMLFYRAV